MLLHPDGPQIHSSWQDQEALGVPCEKPQRHREPPLLSCVFILCPCILLCQVDSGETKVKAFVSSICIQSSPSSSSFWDLDMLCSPGQYRVCLRDAGLVSVAGAMCSPRTQHGARHTGSTQQNSLGGHGSKENSRGTDVGQSDYFHARYLSPKG